MSELPPRFIGFVVGQLMKAGETDAVKAQTLARAIYEAWNKEFGTNLDYEAEWFRKGYLAGQDELSRLTLPAQPEGRVAPLHNGNCNHPGMICPYTVIE